MNKKNNKVNIFITIFLCFFVFNTFVLADTDLCAKNTIKDIQNLFNFAKIIVPLIVIGLSIYDFILAISSKDAKDVKKAFSKFMKRLILALIFFFLPVLINTLLNLFGINSSTCVN